MSLVMVRMLSGFLLTTLLLTAPACRPDDVESEAVEYVQTAERVRHAMPTATKAQVLSRLSKAGLKPEVKVPQRFSKNMERVLADLPQEPRDTFLLAVENEGMIALEFSTVNLAKMMDNQHDQGFRYKNWYFGGALSSEVTGRMQSALGS